MALLGKVWNYDVHRKAKLKTGHFEMLLTLFIFIDFHSRIIYIFFKGAVNGLIGNPVKIGNGPATVIGDEICVIPLRGLAAWEGEESRLIQESEDLP